MFFSNLWVICGYRYSNVIFIMTELCTAKSFIIRIYRVDSTDPHRLTGQIEALDGCGKSVSFTDVDGMVAELRRSIGRKSRRTRKSETSPEMQQNENYEKVIA